MRSLFLVVLFGLACALLPARQASATTWQDASTNCAAVMSYVLANLHPYQVPTDCFYRSSPWPEYSMHSNVGQTMDCADYGVPASAGIGSCLVTEGGAPPDCSVKAGQTLSPGTTYDSFPDGTACDSYCTLTLLVGGVLNGYMAYNGQMCPFVSSTSPPPIPKVEPIEPAPPICNADGSCVTCSGDTCATTGATTPPAPPPPAGGSSSGNHDTSTTTNTTTSTTTNTTTTITDGGTGTGTGDSTSTTTGTGTGTSDSKCDSGACDVGEADGDVGGLYQSSGQTPNSVYSTFAAQIKGSPIVSAAGGFFNVQAGGSCPSWHIPGNQFWGAAGFDFSFFCSSAMLALFQLAGYLVLAGAAFCAFRIAIY